MTKREHSTSTSFLAELIIVVFFLITSAAIITQAFAGADRIRTQARDLNAATLQAQNAAEAFRSLEDPADLAECLARAGLNAQGAEISATATADGAVPRFVIWFDSDWQVQAEKGNRQVVLTVVHSEQTEDGTYLVAHIEARVNDSLIYTLGTARFVPARKGGGA